MAAVVIKQERAFVVRSTKTMRWIHQFPYRTDGGVRSAIEWMREHPRHSADLDELEIVEVEVTTTVVDSCSARALLRAPDRRPNANANGKTAEKQPLSELVPEQYRPDPPPPPPKAKAEKKPREEKPVAETTRWSWIEVD